MMNFSFILLLTLTCWKITRPITERKAVPSYITNQIKPIITCVIHFVSKGESIANPGTIGWDTRVSTTDHYKKTNGHFSVYTDQCKYSKETI